MAEQIATINGGHEVCYETFGDPSDPALLLMMGLATQMLGWSHPARISGQGALGPGLVRRSLHVTRA